MDKVVEKLVALGVPGLLVVVIIATSGLAGGAAIVAALAVLGGPFGMLGGLVALGVLGLVADAVAKYGVESVFKNVVAGLRAKGMTRAQIRAQLDGYPITADLKRRVLAEFDKT